MLANEVSYKAAYEREKQARLHAEELLENKTREIFSINEQLKAQANALERSNEELTQFAFVASHDLKEPLRKIKTFSGFLLEECLPLLPEEGQDYIKRMSHAVDRMDALIESLLHYSRITRRHEPFTQVDLRKTMQNVLSDLEGRIKDNQGQINIPADLPTIEADAVQIHQLLQNLLGNALKFRQPNQNPIINITSTTNENHQCEICICDNGVGFEEKYKNKIFGIFQRLHSQAEYEGSGIGLAICKRIVDRHHGTIEVRSALGMGTTFTISLPVRQEESLP